MVGVKVRDRHAHDPVEVDRLAQSDNDASRHILRTGCGQSIRSQESSTPKARHVCVMSGGESVTHPSGISRTWASSASFAL